jgi:hypothetical protein
VSFPSKIYPFLGFHNTFTNISSHSTTTSCKNAHDRPACVWQSRVESFFMKLMNAIQLPGSTKNFIPTSMWACFTATVVSRKCGAPRDVSGTSVVARLLLSP